MTEQQLRAWTDAYLQKDLETVMQSIADDCVYITTTGPGPGIVYTGKNEIERAFAEMFAEEDDGSTLGLEAVFVSGARGVTEWSVAVEGKVVMRGCDLYEFAEGRILRKDVFRKVMA